MGKVRQLLRLRCLHRTGSRVLLPALHPAPKGNTELPFFPLFLGRVSGSLPEQEGGTARRARRDAAGTCALIAPFGSRRSVSLDRLGCSRALALAAK